MCGIVGYIGKQNSQEYLLGGLKRLEYRGYDSAGIATISSDSSVTLLRTSGKIANLESKIKENRNDDHLGIGHTRWATHGDPSKRNAHPHHSGHLYLVHNGIIENYQNLKTQISQHVYQSDTDSEVLVALIDSFYQDGKTSLFEAVNQALSLIRGTYGIAVISDLEPNKIIAARLGSPLIIGVGQHETFLASDASALIGNTRQAIYLDDGEIATITADNIEIKTLDSQPVSKKLETIQDNLSTIQKDGYDHFLLKEIMEQPRSLVETIRGRINQKEYKITLGGLNLTPQELKQLRHILMVGCGTANHAAQVAAYYIEQFVPDLTIETVVASEFRYRQAHIPKHSVALIVSQSGETADTLACLRMIKKRRIKTLGVINVVGSTIAREVDGGVYVHAGPEISVASTKAFTSQVVTIMLFGLAVAQAKGVDSATTRLLIDEIIRFPQEIDHLLQVTPKQVQALAQKYQSYNHAIYLGRNTAYPVALEGALKLKEISYIDANAYPMGELKHGPLALIDDRFFEFVMLPNGELYEKSISSIQEIIARGGHVAVITDVDCELPVESIVRIETNLKKLTPLLFNIINQLFAYYITVAKGYDVDRPRNLAKSVTVE